MGCTKRGAANFTPQKSDKIKNEYQIGHILCQSLSNIQIKGLEAISLKRNLSTLKIKYGFYYFSTQLTWTILKGKAELENEYAF